MRKVGNITGIHSYGAEEGAVPTARLSKALRDHYRYPENFVDFGISGNTRSIEGYFQFGPDITCYGRHSEDAIQHADGRLMLPFDPTKILSNLRLERYAAIRGLGRTYEHVLRKAYYCARPLMTMSMRSRIQRFHARNWQTSAFPHWPVDTTVENMCERLLLLAMQAKGVESVPFVWFWPRGAHACLMMTHDVETQAGRDFSSQLMDLDEFFGIKASLQIVPEKRYAVTSHLLKEIRQRGFEIAVQDLNHDGRLFDNKKEFLRRAERINRYAIEFGAKGFRSAVMYRNPEWLNFLGFSFDMSFPNVAPLDPQRGGCCTVFPYYIGHILELPVTTTQDYTLFHVLRERSINLWKKQIELIMAKHGLASFIIHPDYVMTSGTNHLLRELLCHLRDLSRENDIWQALPTEVDRWWRARSNMVVVKDGSSWRIEGRGSEHAVLAYAKNVDDRLVYELGGVPGATHSNVMVTTLDSPEVSSA
jgi:hypothetical protein